MTPVWADCVTESGRFVDATRLYEAPDGSRFVLPLATWRRFKAPFRLLDAWPGYWVMGGDGGGLAGERETRVDDVQGVLRDLAGLGAARVRIAPSRRDAHVWEDAVDSCADIMHLHREALQTHEVDLSGGFETVWSELFGWKLRGKCKRAEREGVTIEHAVGEGLLDVFDALHRQAMDRWTNEHWLPPALARRVLASQSAQPKLRTVARRVGKAFTVWVASQGGRPVSAIVLLTKGESATYWCGATDRDISRNSGAVHLLHSRAIEYSCTTGAVRYDMGSSGLESIRRFKESLHAHEVQHSAYVLERLPITAAERQLRSSARVAAQRARQARARLVSEPRDTASARRQTGSA
jgi:hypothetical protein